MKLFTGSSFLHREAIISGSELKRSSVDDGQSVITNSKVENSKVEKSTLVDSLVVDSLIRESVSVRAKILKSSIRENSYVGGVLMNVLGISVVVESGAIVVGVQLQPGTHIKDGRWIRAPHRVTDTSFPYDITESVDDQILVGCYSRSAAKWLKTTEEAAARIGLTKQQWIDYIKAIEDVALFKALNRSPTSLKGK